MKNKFLNTVLVGAILSVYCLNNVANANAINIDMATFAGIYSGTGAASDTGTYWNDAATVNGSYQNLLQSDGVTVTNVGIQLRGWGGTYTYEGANQLTKDRFYGPSSGNAYVDINGLSANTTYEIYAYASYWDSQYNVNGATQAVATGNALSTVWVEGDQYVKLIGLADAVGNLTLTVSAGGGTEWTTIAGLQIMDSEAAQAVPEPSTLAIFSLGLIGLASRRFKKNA
ncbi:MAG: hypothetical protein ACJA13_001586 [Paraglaciecola sp.]|jgi:hypothetical protein